ncbi:MAG: GntR family transcriptional regulator [Rhizobiaceae bacterium]
MSKKETLYNDLKRQILTLKLEPGISLDETRLGKKYTLSRTPVRDVFRRLAGEGFLNIEENRGAFVSPLTYKALRDFFLIAPPIYAVIAKLAAQNRTPKQLLELKDTQTNFRNAIASEEPAQMAYYNNQFHLILGEMADNQYLWPSLQRLLIDHGRIGHTFYRPRDAEMKKNLATACLHHDQFIEAIEARDTQTAEKLVHKHWELSRGNIEMFVSPDPVEIRLSPDKTQP